MNIKKLDVWKCAWNPAGYEPAEEHIDTSKKAVGDTVRLPRSHFRADNFTAWALNPSGQNYMLLKVLPYGSTGKADVLLVGIDDELSRLAGVPIYSKIKLESKKALTSNLKVLVRYVGDTIDPKDFNQSLNQDADVKHKSLTCEEVETDELFANIEIETPKLSGVWGSISLDVTELQSPRLRVGSLDITEERVTLNSNKLCTKNGGELRFDGFRWRTTNEPLLSFSGDLTRIPDHGVPVALGNPTSYTFVPWFSIDPSERTVVVEKLRVGSTVLSEEELIKLKALVSTKKEE